MYNTLPFVFAKSSTDCVPLHLGYTSGLIRRLDCQSDNNNYYLKTITKLVF